MNFGIICEFNPFHKGHGYLFDEARKLGAKNIVCVMSGNAVQRGELAVADKYDRAAMALRGGADLILELPFPWSSGSAEYFGMAGIKALEPYCDAIIFGSECGDINILKKAAQAAIEPEFREKYEQRKKNGEGAAAAYFSLLEEITSTKLSSNDILGVEYIKAAKRISSNMDFYTVKRIGNAYRDDNIYEGQVPSASAIRKEIKAANKKRLEELGMDFEAYSKEGFTDVSYMEKAMLLYFRLADPKELSEFAEADGGIAERICMAARESADIDSFWSLLRTKRYTDAKLARAILFCLTKVKRELLLKDPEYLYLLALNKNGREILSSTKKQGISLIPIVTKPADAPRASSQFLAEERLNAFFSLAREKALPLSEAYKKSAFVIK